MIENKKKTLKNLYPELCLEWHPTKNGELTPNDVTYGSNKKVWWQCKNFSNHEWIASIKSRTRGSGCKYCSNQSSAPEIRILCELSSVFKNINSRKKVGNKEIDIFIQDISLGIEYDGFYFHKDKELKDREKNIFLEKLGINIIRVREHPLPKICNNDVIVSRLKIYKSCINKLLLEIKNFINVREDFLLREIDEYINSNEYINQELFKKYLSSFPSPLPENSLDKKFPKIAAEWHYDRNSPLTPLNFPPSSHKVVWWQCQKNQSHAYQVSISSRTRLDKPTGCSYCAGKKVSPENSLTTKFPKIAAQWHPTKNGKLTPDDFTFSANKKVWWQCLKYINHEWQSKINTRTNLGTGNCPFCTGKKVSPENSLTTKFPKIAAQWHPTKNGTLTPDDVTSGSSAQVWWQCPKNNLHVYKSVVSSRTKKLNPTGCSYCAGKKVSPENSLTTKFPNIAAQWHPTKNGTLTPDDVTYGSTQKIWWECPLNSFHIYEATINNRTKNNKPTGCPFCAGKKVSPEKSLSVKCPKIAAQWHPSKNGKLTPDDVTYGSNIKIWWYCLNENTHVWEESIKLRRRANNNCRFCKIELEGD